MVLLDWRSQTESILYCGGRSQFTVFMLNECFFCCPLVGDQPDRFTEALERNKQLKPQHDSNFLNTELDQEFQVKNFIYSWQQNKFLGGSSLCANKEFILWTSTPVDTWDTAAGPAASSAISRCSACGNSESTDPRPAGSRPQALYLQCMKKTPRRAGRFGFETCQRSKQLAQTV